jgi:hypothetical protein
MSLLDAARAHLEPLRQTLESGDVFRLGANDAQLRALFGDCVLRAMLPQRYGVATGRVLATEGALETDALLIFDALHALPLGVVHPIETVYALCDVTASLRLDAFEARLRVIEQFKRLRRETATDHDVSPVHHLRMFGARYAQLSENSVNPMLGYVFAGSGDDPEAFLATLNALIRGDQLRAEHTPDAIFCMHDRWAIIRQTRMGEVAVPRTTFAKFGLYALGDDALLWLYVVVNTTLSQVQLRGPDLMRALAELTNKR